MNPAPAVTQVEAAEQPSSATREVNDVSFMRNHRRARHCRVRFERRVGSFGCEIVAVENQFKNSKKRSSQDVDKHD